LIRGRGKKRKEGLRPSLTYTPPSLIDGLFSKGRGIKGEGLFNNLLLREGGQGDRILTISL